MGEEGKEKRESLLWEVGESFYFNGLGMYEAECQCGARYTFWESRTHQNWANLAEPRANLLGLDGGPLPGVLCSTKPVRVVSLGVTCTFECFHT